MLVLMLVAGETTVWLQIEYMVAIVIIVVLEIGGSDNVCIERDVGAATSGVVERYPSVTREVAEAVWNANADTES